jgi:acetylxylan esterase
VRYGVGNATDQISAFAKKCPEAQIVLIGYSQGLVHRSSIFFPEDLQCALTWTVGRSKVFDDALCGGGDPNMGITNTNPTIAQFNIKAVLLPADDRFTPGEPYHVGNATVGGVS